jgi:putative component of membrane protein insertase Oxa1/YidC/SpoIIIJ protein YidD
MEAVERHGVVRGGLMAGWRLLRCHPLVKGGYDPVVKPPACCKVRAESSIHLTGNCRASLGWTGEGAHPQMTQ